MHKAKLREMLEAMIHEEDSQIREIFHQIVTEKFRALVEKEDEDEKSASDEDEKEDEKSASDEDEKEDEKSASDEDECEEKEEKEEKE